MTLEDFMAPVTGSWTGTNRLRVMPDDPYDASNSIVRVEVVAGGNAAVINYTWRRDGTAQDGVMILTNGTEPETVKAIWIDSWHQNPQWIELDGKLDAK